MMPTESGILLEFTKIFNQFFYLSSPNENLRIDMLVWYMQLKESKKFLSTFIEKYLNKWTLSKKHKIAFSFKTATYDYIIFMTVTRNETTTTKTSFWIPARRWFFLYLK